MLRGLFVAGTDTDAGKTIVSAALVAALSACYWKPIQSGLDDLPGGDSQEVARLTGHLVTDFPPPTYQFAASLAPDQAAGEEGAILDPGRIALPDVDRMLVVEAAGGLLVPLDGTTLMVDLARRLGLPIVLAARTGLGTLNHTLLSLEALRHRGLPVAGVLFSGPDHPRNVEAIRRLGGAPVLGRIPWLDPLTPAALALAAAQLDLSALLELDRTLIWHPYTQVRTADAPLAIRSAGGATLTDFAGREILDLVSSWWVTLHGHAHPAIARAVGEQAGRMEQLIFAGFTHEPAVTLCQRLTAVLPPELRRCFFSDNGSTAVEVALKMALQARRNLGQPERSRFLAFAGGYHGDTVGAMSAGVSSHFFEAWRELLFPVDILPVADTWLEDPAVEAKEASALARLDQHLEACGAQTVAAIIEPLVQGASGMRMHRPAFLRGVAERLRAHGVLVILDEVMTGFGRLGALFGCIAAELVPDFICLSKGLTGGALPMALTVTTEAIHEAFLDEAVDRAFLHGHSFTANPLGCAAALASLDLLLDPGCAAARARIERRHRTDLGRLVAASPRAARLRIQGTIAAFEVESPGLGYGSAFEARMKRWFLKRGLLLRPLGNTLYLLPPFCITDEQLDRAYAGIADGLACGFAD